MVSLFPPARLDATWYRPSTKPHIFYNMNIAAFASAAECERMKERKIITSSEMESFSVWKQDSAKCVCKGRLQIRGLGALRRLHTNTTVFSAIFFFHFSSRQNYILHVIWFFTWADTIYTFAAWRNFVWRRFEVLHVAVAATCDNDGFRIAREKKNADIKCDHGPNCWAESWDIGYGLIPLSTSRPL